MKMLSSSAKFSPCRKYRYDLVRIWDHSLPYCAFICLNPSTATEMKNDNTVSKCIGYAERWGYGGFIMLNVFAFRATKPKDMKTCPNPVGKENNEWILRWIRHPKVRLIVCAWGNDGMHLNRHKDMKKILDKYKIACLKVTGKNQPWHPLYLKNNLTPTEYDFGD